MEDVIDSINDVQPIKNNGHWAFIDGDWRKLAGNFDIDDHTVSFNIYYYDAVKRPRHGFNIVKHLVKRSTFIWYTHDEMLKEKTRIFNIGIA